MLAFSAIPLQLVAGDNVTEDEALAQAMGYKLDASTVDTAKFPKRAGDAGAPSSAITVHCMQARLMPSMHLAASSRPCRSRQGLVQCMGS